MDPGRLQLLLAVFIVGPAHFECAWFTSDPEEFEGDIMGTTKEPERYPYHKEKKLGGGYFRQIWNNKVELVRCLENEDNKFKLSCGKKNTDGEITYRAILHDHDQGKPLMTWNVVSCGENLLNSVSVVDSSNLLWNRYDFYIIKKSKSCDGYTYYKKLQWDCSFVWTVTNYGYFNTNYCPSASKRKSRKNSETFINGWKEIALPENPKDCT